MSGVFDHPVVSFRAFDLYRFIMARCPAFGSSGRIQLGHPGVAFVLAATDDLRLEPR